MDFDCYDTGEMIQAIAIATVPRIMAIAIITTPLPTSNIGSVTTESGRVGFIGMSFSPTDKLGKSILSG